MFNPEVAMKAQRRSRVGGQSHAPSASPSKRNPVSKIQEAGHGPRFDSRTGQPILSRYTEKTIPANRYRMTYEKVFDVSIKVKYI